jgi:hypothetical protein
MFYAPASGGAIRNDLYPVPIPKAEQMDVWDKAKEQGLVFWRRVSADSRISDEFRQIAGANITNLFR